MVRLSLATPSSGCWDPGVLGDVYLAQHPRLPRREALKILRPDVSTDETFQQRFIREADSIAASEHPHLVVGSIITVT
jgi:serine/threonine protein kinase